MTPTLPIQEAERITAIQRLSDAGTIHQHPGLMQGVEPGELPHPGINGDVSHYNYNMSLGGVER